MGLRITVHQFRHAAAAIYLKHRPGDYETVRRTLAHRSIETTTKFYCGLQTMQATEQFGKLIRQQIKFDAIPSAWGHVRDERIGRDPVNEGKVLSLPRLCGLRLTVMHGIQLAGLQRASTPEVQRAT